MKTILACGLTAACAAQVFAHDLVGALTQEPRSASRPIAQALSEAVADESTRSVLANLRLWPVPRKVSICFVSGSPELRKRVVAAMTAHWPIATLSSARLDYDKASFAQAPDCATPATQDIRVGFKEGGGHWSYVGIESLNHQPSMNFDRIDTKPQAEFERLVAHEMGHALGLEHEHQSPAAPLQCNWDFTYLGKAYVWESEAAMKSNFTQFQDYLQNGRHAYVFSSYDQKSVMHYAFEPQAFTSGMQSPCFITQNDKPSDLDRTAIRIAYGGMALAQQGASKGAIPQVLQKFSAARYGDLPALLNLKAKLLNE